MFADEFRSHAIGFWDEIQAGDSRRADAHTAALERLVTATTDAPDHLSVMLHDTDDRVRYAAAASAGAANDEARDVLAALAERPDGLIAPTARLLLAQWAK